MSLVTISDRRLVARTGLDLLLTNVRYWSNVAPIVRRELRRWELRAQAIENPELRRVALEKLHGESFHAEAAAMLATLAPRDRRSDVVKAIVALELLFDYLDGLTERPSVDPLGEGERLFGAYTDAVTDGSRAGGHSARNRGTDHDGGYLESLSRTVTAAMARLPAASAITDVAHRAAMRGAQTQIRMHAALDLGTEQLEQWASAEAVDMGIEWRDLLAGAASSVLALHALIIAAADPLTTCDEAIAIESAYFSICVLLTLLDGLVDHERDSHQAPRPGYVDLYETRDALSRAVSNAAQRAAGQARLLRHGPHHAMALVGVVAYYTSDPGAENKLARPVVEHLHRQLAPLIFPTLACLRAWRIAKRARKWRSPYNSRPTWQLRTNGECNET
jgi:tetraprenyl-beta-curcumene synthase